MKSEKKIQSSKEDPTAVQRKKDHIELAFKSQVNEIDERFNYEPLISGLQGDASKWGSFDFLRKRMKNPIWVSSMTGGTEWAATINANLARAVKEFGLGMGLGSCRSLLYDDTHFKDFNVRPVIGDQPFYANLGIAQVEELLKNNALGKATAMVDKLEADGLIIHINPLQESMQPEGDIYQDAPIDSIKRVLDKVKFPLIIKEVGQGMGPESMDALLRLPIAAVDFAASGGTNFALLELLRDDPEVLAAFDPIIHVGHKAEEMVDVYNTLLKNNNSAYQCKEVIISGGIKTFLDGYYLISKINAPAVYGQASEFLKYARGDYEALRTHVQRQIKGLSLAKSFLRLK